MGLHIEYLDATYEERHERIAEGFKQLQEYFTQDDNLQLEFQRSMLFFLIASDFSRIMSYVGKPRQQLELLQTVTKSQDLTQLEGLYTMLAELK